MSYDLYVVSKDPSAALNERIFSLGGARSVGVEGFYKTIMKWVKCLFTAKGTDITNLDYGTFFGDLVGGNYTTEEELRDVVAMSVQSATEQIRALQLEYPVTSYEQLQSATVDRINVSGSSAEVYVTLTNAARQRLILAVPAGVALPPSTP